MLSSPIFPLERFNLFKKILMGCGSARPEAVKEPLTKEPPKAAPPIIPPTNCVIMIGAPGCGKSTQAERIKKKFGLMYI